MATHTCSPKPKGKKGAPVDFTTVSRGSKIAKPKDPAYTDGTINYVSDAKYMGCKYNKLNIRVDDITEKSFDDAEAFAEALEAQLTIGNVKYLEQKDASHVTEKPGLSVIDIYSSPGLEEAKEAFEGMFGKVKLAKTGGHWTIEQQRLTVSIEGREIKLRGPSRMLYRHLLAIKNDKNETGKWDAAQGAWVISFEEEQDKDGVIAFKRPHGARWVYA